MAMALDRNSDKDNANEWIRFGMRLGVQSILHPFEYSKVLIQVRIFVQGRKVYLFT